ncbi:MAG TPA: hypothetical protein PKI49_12050 [Pseudomonadota bacterium]|nr:hypothetical protein [Pseudomonadota bacterium]HNI60923.1 hypothetical protein [Pseudomonadota bacterium]HNK44947.1 hypothetical protein [Pseudomonadota bacterium]HNN54302.1 hypothetical protein [Pseudomonadota bacterium]HNO69236.1 hypothetical protein [Pseudomonadota bacterium]
MSAALCLGCPNQPEPQAPTVVSKSPTARSPAPDAVTNQLAADLAMVSSLSDAGDAWVAPPSVPSTSPEFVEAQFLDTYRLFVPRDFTSQEKDIRWSRYYQGRWVRWTGQLRFVTADAFLFHHLGPTSSYEVSLQIPEPERSRLRQTLQLGRFYNYVGRLLRYETTFRVIALEQGSVLSPNDIGVPGTLASLPWSHDPPPLPGLVRPGSK